MKGVQIDIPVPEDLYDYDDPDNVTVIPIPEDSYSYDDPDNGTATPHP